MRTFWRFIRAITAVIVIVTFPRLCNAFVVLASEFLGGTVPLRVLADRVRLVGTVPTVVISITGEPFRYAFARSRALEHPRIAWLVTV